MSKDKIGSIKDYTPNFKIIIPRFDLATWHDYIEENFRNIDALFFNLFGINNYSGSWKQITEYKQGQVLFIGDDLDINGNVTEFSGRLVKVLVDHVTDNSDYFNVFYNLHSEYYELFADASTAQIYAQQAQSYKNETETLRNEADLIKSDVITKQNEINDTISEFNADFSVKTEEIMQKFEEGKVIIAQETAISTENIEKSRIWAEGEQAEVKPLGGSLSSMGAADLAYALANAPEDTPIDTAKMFAMNIFKGEKGDKGDKGDAGKDGVDGKSVFDGYATNCITEIPQDIKLELNNGTLTLKAGSRVYIPNGKNADGSNKFDVVVIASDLCYDIVRNSQEFVYIKNGVLYARETYYTESGTSSTLTTQYRCWYDTINNLIKFTDNNSSTWTSGFSLPLCLITSNTASITSIDQVFNGFGYIGSTIFALPNVKGLIPNGRNADGSLKNIEVTVDKVSTMTYAAAATNIVANINTSSVLSTAGILIESETEPSGSYILWYKPSENILRWKGVNTFVVTKNLTFANFSSTATQITSLNHKHSFQAVDRNDSSWVSAQAMPSEKYIDLTLGASGSTYAAPANGWFLLRKKASSTTQTLQVENISSGRFQSYAYAAIATQLDCLTTPCKRGDVIRVNYTYGSTTDQIFRFYYAEGDKS